MVELANELPGLIGARLTGAALAAAPSTCGSKPGEGLWPKSWPPLRGQTHRAAVHVATLGGAHRIE